MTICDKTMLALRLAIGLFALSMLAGPALSAGRAITIDDLLAVKTVADPQISPDGKSVVYVVSEIDREAGKSNSSLWLVLLPGGEPKRLTTTPGSNNHPRWSPDGKTIAFVSSRGGSSQVWLLPIDGGEPRQLTHLPIDVSGPLWSPKGDKIAFTAEVYPGKTPEETEAKDKEKEASKSKARIFDKLMVRHWASWDEAKRSHLFVCDSTSGLAKDFTIGFQVNIPPGPFGGSNDYCWSPDGKELAFTAEPLKDHAWSTNSDIWTVALENGQTKNLTEANKAADAQPSYSPDGKYLAYVRQSRPGFESDMWILTVRDLRSGAATELTGKLDRPVLSFVWGGETSLFAVIDDEGTEPVVSVSFGEGGVVAPIPVQDNQSVDTLLAQVKGGANTAVQYEPKSRTLILLRSTSSRPAELYQFAYGSKKPVPLTHHNDALIANLDLHQAEEFRFKGAGGDNIFGWLVKPPGFDASKKYPVVFLIHGGPQGAWHDDWVARWNYQMFASKGFAVVAVNPRGSTGFGQKFTDLISQDWTGMVYEDLMKGLDHALKTYSYLDGDKVAAAGGSYGGFMVNWIAGHSDRFKALISHAGVFDLESMYFTTEELWFAEWEFGGTPWGNPDHYRERSPSTYAANFKTPTLVIHGALDFRVPDAQGLGMFTALQRRGIESRYLFFPDEGHWILKPANRAVWWREMLGWLETHLK